MITWIFSGHLMAPEQHKRSQTSSFVIAKNPGCRIYLQPTETTVWESAGSEFESLAVHCAISPWGRSAPIRRLCRSLCSVRLAGKLCGSGSAEVLGLD
jgi:hypothetical protein